MKTSYTCHLKPAEYCTTALVYLPFIHTHLFVIFFEFFDLHTKLQLATCPIGTYGICNAVIVFVLLCPLQVTISFMILVRVRILLDIPSFETTKQYSLIYTFN